MEPYDLADKVVLITGGTGGLGSATARALLARGARAALVDIHPETHAFATELSPTRAFGLIADVCDRDAMDVAVAKVADHFGGVDVAIANAGVLGAPSTIRATSGPAAAKVLEVNVNGVLNTVASSLEQVIAQQGQLVLISSVFAFMNGMGAVPYAMSKAAVEQLGRGLRVELAQHGASVLTAYFALIETEMIRSGVDAHPGAAELMASVPRPLRSRLTPDAAAHAIVTGLEHRAARVIRPRRWTPLSLTRGVLGPALDHRFAKDPAILASLKKLELERGSAERKETAS